MMGSTIRDLGSTIKEAKQSFGGKQEKQVIEDDFNEDMDASQS
jgi:Sec-independent protein translocase protein TatA